jgi:hypothetical protein
MRIIEDSAAALFIGAVALLSAVSILGIWDIFKGDVVNKSFMTIGLLAVVSIIVIIAGRFIDRTPDVAPSATAEVFKGIRRLMIVVLIATASLLALTGVLAIWEVISDKAVLYKSLGSLAVIIFAAFVVVMTCLEREKTFETQGKSSFSIGSIILVLFVGWLVLNFSGLFWRF